MNESGIEENIPGFWVSKDYVATAESVTDALSKVRLNTLHPGIDASTVTSRLLKNSEWAAIAYLSMHTAGRTTNGNSLGDNPSGLVGMNTDVGTLVAGGLESALVPYMDKYVVSGDKLTYYSYESKYSAGNTANSYNFTQRKYGDAIVATSTFSGDHSSWFGGYSEKVSSSKPFFIRGDETGNLFSYRAIGTNEGYPAIRNVLIVKSK
jgi:hypothetical protein